MNLPNLLTCSRLVLSVVFIIFLFDETLLFKFIALLVFLLASLTDYWDGRLARSTGEITKFGKLMDPIADKILTLSAFIGFCVLGLIPLWAVAVVMMRDVAITFFRFCIPSKGDLQSARASGKNKTVFQLVYIILVLMYATLRETSFWNPAYDALILSVIYWGMLSIVAITVWSAFRYWQETRKAIK